MPLVRRVPKRGFNSPFRVEYQVVNVETLEKLSVDGKVPNGIVSPEVLAKLGVVKKTRAPVKILGNGELKAKLNISANAFSKSAVEKIEKAGGKTQTIKTTAKE
jgi:large subunit ribosomal protein L15